MSDKNIEIAYVGGYWSTNIGNAFFNLGTEYVLSQVFGKEHIHMVFDYSAFVTQWKTSKGNIPWAVDYWAHLNVSYVVLEGPILTKSFLSIWKPTLDILKKRGIGYMILSAGMMKSNENAVREIKAYFQENPPYVITTRDRDTYKTYLDSVPRIYDGICFAFFMPECYRSVTTDLTPVLAVNFDKIDEPYIYLDTPDKKVDRSFEFNGHQIGLRFGSVFAKIGLKTDRFTDAIIYAMSPLPRAKRPAKIGPYTVIRPDHRFNPLFVRKAYRYPNSFCGDIPHTYANIYAEAELTLSDRVHACAIALSYGNSAYLFAKTGRSSLLHRVGAMGIEDHPVSIDLEKLKQEKRTLIEWLRSIEY